jgi:hypothetical protein
MPDDLTDEQLLSAEHFLSLTGEQLKRRHALLQKKNPVKGTLTRMTDGQLQILANHIKNQHTSILERLDIIQNNLTASGDEDAADNLIFAIIRDIKEVSHEAGFSSERYSVIDVLDYLPQIVSPNKK